MTPNQPRPLSFACSGTMQVGSSGRNTSINDALVRPVTGAVAISLLAGYDGKSIHMTIPKEYAVELATRILQASGQIP